MRRKAILRLFVLAMAGIAGLLAAGAIASPVTFDYDALGRLVRVVQEDGRRIVYSYDAAGNRTAREFGLAVPFVRTITISGSGPVDLRSLADAQGYDGESPATITYVINAGTVITGASGGGAGVDTGSWPGGVAISLTLNNQGTIRGGGGSGGRGGDGGPSPGSSGDSGGAAINARVNLVVNNSGGLVQGGSGGGGGEAGHAKWVSADQAWEPWDGGGGGGGGWPNGGGGAGGTGLFGGRNGSPGSSGTPASGGTSGDFGGTGGGPAALAGTKGGNFITDFTTFGGSGGAAGAAIRKNGNSVTVTGGTVTGAVG